MTPDYSAPVVLRMVPGKVHHVDICGGGVNLTVCWLDHALTYGANIYGNRAFAAVAVRALSVSSLVAQAARAIVAVFEGMIKVLPIEWLIRLLADSCL